MVIIQRILQHLNKNVFCNTTSDQKYISDLYLKFLHIIISDQKKGKRCDSKYISIRLS